MHRRPIVDDDAEQIGIGTLRDRLEEAAAHRVAATGDAGALRQRGGARHDVGQVEQHALGVGVRGQDGGKQGAVAAAEFDDRSETPRSRMRRALDKGISRGV